jgi:hypothetical protein
MHQRGVLRVRLHRPAAVDHEGGAGDEAGCLRGEEDDSAAQFRRVTPAAERDLGQEGLIGGGVVAEAAVERRVEGAGAERVDVDALVGPFEGHGARQLHQTAFGGVVGRPAGHGDEALDTAHVDDAAPAALDHLRRHGAADQERAGEVGGHHLLPFRLAELQRRLANVDAGVVDQDVDVAERGDGLLHHRRHRSVIGDVGFDGERPVAILRAHTVRRGLRLGVVPAGEDDVGPGAGERAGHRFAQPLAAAGDERHAAIQPE